MKKSYGSQFTGDPAASHAAVARSDVGKWINSEGLEVDAFDPATCLHEVTQVEKPWDDRFDLRIVVDSSIPKSYVDVAVHALNTDGTLASPAVMRSGFFHSPYFREDQVDASSPVSMEVSGTFHFVGRELSSV